MELEQNFSALRSKILKINKDYKVLLEKYSDLEEKYNLLKDKYDEAQKRKQELIEEQKQIKLISAISGNPDHNRLMKNHINRLIKEIDACIAHLKNTGM